ncbi:sugar transferase [Cypionkella sinensis]|uniref:Sugar transferase n=1 Tax=Cypionkella sinensis TaxID=1756043 RepID=A0ABV7J376_9RHOB
MTINYREFYSFRSASADAEERSDDLAASRLVAVSPTGRGPYRRFFKRAFDVTAIVVAAPAVLPIVAVAAVLVARDGGSPFYSQMRVGKGGKRFRMWKLRSMVRDADERMEEFLAANPEARLEWDSTQKLKADPRITRMGKFLRKSSLDELPQLWNVLVGDMSLVGPRPMMISQQSLYPGQAYYALRPGITGYWQTSGRNRTTFEARAAFDDAYEADLSMLTDVKVLAATVGVVVNGTGY